MHDATPCVVRALSLATASAKDCSGHVLTAAYSLVSGSPVRSVMAEHHLSYLLKRDESVAASMSTQASRFEVDCTIIHVSDLCVPPSLPRSASILRDDCSAKGDTASHCRSRYSFWLRAGLGPKERSRSTTVSRSLWGPRCSSAAFQSTPSWAIVNRLRSISGTGSF